ncbi:MAG TPA: hypothetical protein VF037_06285 [Gemmatimonadales bacterium]
MAGLRAALFLAGFRAAAFLAGRRTVERDAAFFAGALREVFFAREAFFGALRDDFRPADWPDFRALLPPVFRGMVVREVEPAGRAEPLIPPEPLPRSGEAGIENAGGAGGGGSGSDIGFSSIHPPLVQPVSISSDPDIGAPSAQRGVTRRRFSPRGRGEGVE